MDFLWTWGGEYFGYRIDEKLFAYYGLQVERIYQDEIYGPDGRYLGEIKNEKRLITQKGKKLWAKPGFSPARHRSSARYVNRVGYVMYAGYEDFPSPDDFR